MDIQKIDYKNRILKMRKNGFSYSEIRKVFNIPKSTLTLWFKDLELNQSQKKRLEARKLKMAKLNLQKRIKRNKQNIQKIQKISSSAIKNVSNKEFWLMGIMLYWSNTIGNKKDSYSINTFSFSSGNTKLIQFFLKWLKEIGKIPAEDINLDIYLKYKKTGNNRDNVDLLKKEKIKSKAISYWSNISGFKRSVFKHVYFNVIKNTNKNVPQDNIYGFLRIRVAKSSYLAKQVAGWIDSICHDLHINKDR